MGIDVYCVAGLANANGTLVEAYDYDAYGKVRVCTAQAAPCDQPGDVDGDGDVDMADFEALSLCYGPSGVPGDCPPGALERNPRRYCARGHYETVERSYPDAPVASWQTWVCDEWVDLPEWRRSQR
jgi:hypothetical protein